MLSVVSFLHLSWLRLLPEIEWMENEWFKRKHVDVSSCKNFKISTFVHTISWKNKVFTLKFNCMKKILHEEKNCCQVEIVAHNIYRLILINNRNTWLNLIAAPRRWNSKTHWWWYDGQNNGNSSHIQFQKFWWDISFLHSRPYNFHCLVVNPKDA